MKYKTIHEGQKHRYGGMHYIYDIYPEENDSWEDILAFCTNDLMKERHLPVIGTDVPSKPDYLVNDRYGGKHWGDADYHFRGYWNLTQNDDETIYRFERYTPWDG